MQQPLARNRPQTLLRELRMAAKMGGGPLSPSPALAAISSAATEAENVRRRQEIEPLDEEIDPAVQELCDYFNIEDRWVKRLNETMRKRQDTKQEDIEKLYEVEIRRNDIGLSKS